MSGSVNPIRRTTLALAAALSLAQPALASPPECTCQNLESLQPDYQNAVDLQNYFKALAEHLETIESETAAVRPDPKTVMDKSKAADDKYRQENPPNRGLRSLPGYNGPASIDMTETKGCFQDPAQLAAMEAKSPCKAIADAALEHENKHKAKCEGMGPNAYWGRLRSEIAREEEALYEEQAAKLKAELRRVIEAAEVTYWADWELAIDVQGMAEYGYAYSAQSEDIGNATGGDTWTMTGEGTSTVAWTKAVIAGMSCTPSGAVNTTFNTTMTTDGLVFSLDVEELSSSGALAISCPGGGGGGGPVGEGGGGGQIVSVPIPLKEGDNLIPGDMGGEIRAIMAGMGTVSGDGVRVLSVRCYAP